MAFNCQSAANFLVTSSAGSASTSEIDMHLQLFLAHADTCEPVLEGGLIQRAVQSAPVSRFPLPASIRLARVAPPDSLPEQRWAVIAPKGPAGDRLLDLVKPLRQHRAEQQQAETLVYRVDPGMDLTTATRWIQNDYWDAVKRDEDDLPRYLLVLGDAGAISWDFQQLLGGEAFIGRLAFPDDQGYEAYVDKVLRWEREVPEPGARALFFTVRDGSKATTDGYQHLMRPSLKLAEDRRQAGKFAATGIFEIGGGEPSTPGGERFDRAEQMLAEAERTRAGLLFSMSHGAGRPRGGWSSPQEQRALQGSLLLGRSGARMTAGDIKTRPFLPGGVWLLFACYGAGTPEQSAYYPWLTWLHKLGWYSAAEWVLAALPRPGEPPFVAALPQAALANPNGPLGVIGHVDLAWTWSFLDHQVSAGQTIVSPRMERFQGVLRALVNGHRLGVAHDEIARFFRSASTELSAMMDENARLGMTADGRTGNQAREARWASLWMQRQDLCAYVLLGDPAARLPITPCPAGIPVHTSNVGAADITNLERAVLSALQQPASLGAIAERHHIAEADLRRAVDAFMSAGRAALRKPP